MKERNVMGTSIIKKRLKEMYRVSWDNENLRLIIIFNDKALSYIEEKLKRSHPDIDLLKEQFPDRDNSKDRSIFDFTEPTSIKELEEKIKFNIFSFDLSKDFGFGKVIKYLDRDQKGFTRFAIELRDIRKQEDSYFVAISATLNLIMHIINGYEWGEEISEEENSNYQFLTFENSTYTGNVLGRNGIFGYVSASMKNWLKKNQGMDVSVIIKNMTSITDNPNNNNGFKATIKEGGFVIDCSGSECGLNPDNWYDLKNKENVGFKFSCHNVDSLMQQLYLLIGLATLCDLYKESTKKKPLL